MCWATGLQAQVPTKRLRTCADAGYEKRENVFITFIVSALVLEHKQAKQPQQQQQQVTTTVTATASCNGRQVGPTGAHHHIHSSSIVCTYQQHIQHTHYNRFHGVYRIADMIRFKLRFQTCDHHLFINQTSANSQFSM